MKCMECNGSGEVSVPDYRTNAPHPDASKRVEPNLWIRELAPVPLVLLTVVAPMAIIVYGLFR